MSAPETRSEPSGRRVVLTPTPPGLTLLVGGGVIATLGPLFGFLIGSMIGVEAGSGDLNALFIALMAGMVLGGIGIVMVFLGARRLLRHLRETGVS